MLRQILCQGCYGSENFEMCSAEFLKLCKDAIGTHNNWITLSESLLNVKQVHFFHSPFKQLFYMGLFWSHLWRTVRTIWNVVLEKDGEDWRDWSCQKWRDITYSHGLRNVRKIQRRLTGLVISFIGTAFWNTLSKERCMGREDEEEDVRVCWLILWKEEILGTERGRTGSLGLFLASKLWKKLRTSHKTTHWVKELNEAKLKPQQRNV
jgi:hypothetical protein